MSNFAGKVALVTGASSGIGRSTAVRLGAGGARVGVHYRSDEQGAYETVSKVHDAGGTAFALQADLATSDAAQRLWSSFDAHADTVNIVVNNAGAPSKGGIEAATEAEFDKSFAINLRAPLLIIQEALPRMDDGGRIIKLSMPWRPASPIHLWQLPIYPIPPSRPGQKLSTPSEMSDSRSMWPT